MDYDRCSTKDSPKIITVKENGMTFSVINNSRRIVCVIRVDGCLIDDSRERCDYAFEIDDPFRSVIYVELKGGDIAKAFSQLTSTLDHRHARHGRSKRSCFIVASRVPRAGPKVQILKVNMVRLYNAQLYVYTTKAEFIT